jgi:hypothetical protein
MLIQAAWAFFDFSNKTLVCAVVSNVDCREDFDVENLDEWV